MSALSRRSTYSGASTRGEIILLARRVRTLIKLIASFLLVIFTWLELKDVALGTLINYVSPDVVRKLALILYYWCWVFGCTFDVGIQELVYFPKKKFQLSLIDTGLIIGFGVIAAILLWVARDDRKFAGFLSVFFIGNIVGFTYIRRFVRKIIRSSRENYTGDSYGSVKLDYVSGYMEGAWQSHRFAVGVLLLAAIDLVCFYEPARNAVSQFVSKLFPILSQASLFPLLPSVMFFGFVLVMETWIWVKRGKIHVTLDVLTELAEKHDLVGKGTGAIPAQKT